MNSKTFPQKAAWAVFALMVFFGFSCSTDSDSGNSTSTTFVQGLVRCQTCDDVQGWIRNVVLIKVEKEIRQNLDYTLGLYDGVPDDDYTGDDALDDDAADDAVSDDDSSADDDETDSDADDADHSDTNTQESDVDEADIIKTNDEGTVLYILSGGYLILVDPLPAASSHETARLDISGYTREMFVYGSTVVVFSQIESNDLPDEVWPGVPREDLNGWIFVMTVVDVSDKNMPIVMRTFYAEGNYVSSRRIGRLIRVVTATHPVGPEISTWVDPYQFVDNEGALDEQALRDAYAALLEQDELNIENAPLQDWLPRYFDVAGDSMSGGFLSDCEDFFHPNIPLGRTVTSVVTLDLGSPLQKQPDIGVLADGQMLYASTDALYITGSAETFYDWLGSDTQHSLIHKFGISENDTQATYLGSGQIEGYVLNQFSMSEWNGYLRVAATSGWWGENLKNFVYVLQTVDGGLQTVGRIDNIAPGEELKSARFMESKGYLVTFEQTDPLFTVDLTNPAAPVIAGQLEIPGYSTYIHPYDSNHILTIGQSGDSSGATGGVLLQLFDISDFVNPKVTFSKLVGSGWAMSSEALYDHKAFLYYKPLHLLAVPIVDYGWDDWGDDDWSDDDFWGDDDDNVDVPPESAETYALNRSDEPPTDTSDAPYSGFYVYHLTLSDGFQWMGSVDHTSYMPEEGSDYINEFPIPHRAVYIGGYLFTYSDSALVVTEADAMNDVLYITLPYEADGYSWWDDSGWTDDDWVDGGEGDWD